MATVIQAVSIIKLFWALFCDTPVIFFNSFIPIFHICIVRETCCQVMDKSWEFVVQHVYEPCKPRWTEQSRE